MADTFAPQEICDNVAKNPELTTICADLYDILIELDLGPSAIEEEKLEIIKEVSVLVNTKLASIRTAKEQRLKKHRVLKVRALLEHWWKKCHFSEEQQHEFEPYLSQDFTDDLLKVHQQELVKLQQYHADNSHLFEVIDQYMELYDRHLQLELQDKNPNRLFDNRGGQLLKDERDRKAARKNLPSLERRVATLTAEFQRKYGRPFTRDGVSFEESLRRHTQAFKDATFKMPLSEVKVGRGNGGSALKRKIRPVTPPSESKTAQPAKIQKLGARKALL